MKYVWVCNFISEGSFSWELFTLSPKTIWQFQVWQGLNWLVFNNNFSVYAKLFSPFNPVSVTCELFTSSHWVLACSRDDQQSTPTIIIQLKQHSQKFCLQNDLKNYRRTFCKNNLFKGLPSKYGQPTTGLQGKLPVWVQELRRACGPHTWG